MRIGNVSIKQFCSFVAELQLMKSNDLEPDLSPTNGKPNKQNHKSVVTNNLNRNQQNQIQICCTK
jgi:hypothetical protein